MQISEHEFIPYAAERTMPAGRVLVLAPHPDDEVFGCGGAIMRHLAAGDALRVIVVTDGAFGSTLERLDYAALRQAESRSAGAILGYGSPTFWEIPDRGLEYGEPLVQRILTALEGDCADLLYAPSWWEIHPDHISLALAAAEAIRRSARPTRLAMYEVGVPLHPNLLLDISDLRERKRQAIGCFTSQLANQAYDRHVSALNVFRTYTLPESVEAAEAYRLLSADELRKDPVQSIRPGRYYSQSVAPASRTPLVSVILLPLAESSAQRALDSLALQTYPNIEIIVLRGLLGAPPDRDRFPIRLVENEGNRGPVAQANAALEAANGSLLLVIDEPATLLPDHISALVEDLAATQGHRCIHSNVAFTDEGSRAARRLDRSVQRCDLWGGSRIPLSAVLFAKSLVGEDCRFDERFDTPNAWDLLIQLSYRTDLAHCARATLLIERHAGDEPTPPNTAALAEAAEAQVWEKWMERWTSQELRAIVARRNALLAQAEFGNLRLREQLDDLENGLSEAYAERATQQDRLDRCEHEFARLEQALSAIHGELAAERQRTEQAESDLDAIRASTAWRLTAPLRRGIGWLRGQRR